MQGLAGVNQRSNCLEMILWLPNFIGRIPDQSVMDCWGQKTCRGQPEVKLLRNALWLPNLVWRTPDQSAMHCWGHRLCKGQLGSTRGQIAYICPIFTKFGTKNPWPNCNALLGQRSCRGQPESIRGQIA